MGIFHSRARKQRDREEAALLKKQRKQLTDQRRSDQAGDSALRQPTLGAAIRTARRNRSQEK
jgi:hypothetical protein